MNKIELRVKFSKIFNSMFLAPTIWKKRSDFFVTIDYHYFTKFQPKLKNLEVERDVLSRQLAFFSQKFEFLNPRHFIYKDAFSEKRKKPTMLVTIDDGDESIIENLNIFEKYNVPIIIFLPIGLCLGEKNLDGLRSRVFRSFFEIEKKTRRKFLGKADSFFLKVIKMNYGELKSFLSQLNEYKNCPDPISSRKLLSVEDQLNIVNHPLVTLSSHTMSHPILADISSEWAKWEIETSKMYLKKIGGNTRFFAYPYGFKASYSRNIQRYLIDAGVEFAFTTRASRVKLNSNLLELGRVGMHNVYDEGYLYGLIGGAFEFWDKLLGR